jgi:hypothetical protein
VDKHLRTALCDKDPGVMVAALCALQEVAAINPAPYRALIPSLTSILKQARTFLRRAQLLVQHIWLLKCVRLRRSHQMLALTPLLFCAWAI